MSNEDAEIVPVDSKLDLIIGVIHLLVCLVFLIISPYINVEMWLISLICACSLLICSLIIRIIRRKQWFYLSDCFKRLPYQLIPFILSMSIVVITLNYQGIADKIGEFLNKQIQENNISSKERIYVWNEIRDLTESDIEVAKDRGKRREFYEYCYRIYQFGENLAHSFTWSQWVDILDRSAALKDERFVYWLSRTNKKINKYSGLFIKKILDLESNKYSYGRA